MARKAANQIEPLQDAPATPDVGDTPSVVWQNRIVGYGSEDPSGVAFHELNFRTHDKSQQQVLEGLLEEVGFVDDVIVNVRSGDDWPEGERNVKTLIDGHLRCTVARLRGETAIPVKYVDLSPAEERKTLAAFDAVARMAGTDAALFRDLTKDFRTSSAALQELIDGMSGLDVDEAVAGTTDMRQLDTSQPPKMAWCLIGLPTVRFGEAQPAIALLERIPDIILETTVSNA